MWSRRCRRGHNCGSLDSREIAVVLCWQKFLELWLLELSRNLPSGTFGKSTLYSTRRAVHREVSQHKTLHYKTAWGRGTGRSFWVLLITTYYRNCRKSCRHCRNLVLGKLCVLLEIGNWGPRLQEPARWTHQHTGTRKYSSFLLKCLSRAPYWQSLTLCQLAKVKYLKGPELFTQSKQ